MASIKAQIGFNQIGLGEVLKQYRLIVPANQREYSWTEKEVTTLLKDFAKAISDCETEYFVGTIVTIPRGPNELEVVDGQQRLATTAILLCAIRNYLSTTEPMIAENITSGFLSDIDRRQRDRVPKMQLNLDDNDFFRRMIDVRTPGVSVPEPTRASHRLIADAFDQCSRHVKHIVSSLDVKDHGDELNKWIEFTEYSATIILLKVPSEVNAYKMFETLNDRGLKTSQSDLVKNYLFGKAAERIAEAQQKWALMRGTLETLDEDDVTVTFLQYALIVMSGFVTKYAVYEEVQNLGKSPSSSIGFLTQAESLACVYVALFNSEHEKWNSYGDPMRRSIQTLGLFDIRPLRPLMLAVADKFTPREATNAFRLFISWCVRWLIASSTRSGSIESNVSIAAKNVYNCSLKTAADVAQSINNIIPNDDQFRIAFETTTVSKAKLARYYLRSLEQAAKREGSPWFIPNDDQTHINLEHILPEKPEGNWPQFTPDSARAYVKRLGNQALILAKSNSDLKSSSFDVKKAVYSNSPYITTREVSEEHDWNEEKIDSRQKRMAVLALRAWPI